MTKGQERGPFLLPKHFAHAAVAYLVKGYGGVGEKKLGRTILQKLCYFAKANGVPLPFRFEMYHYGPFCQEIFDVTENLMVDDVVRDQEEGQGSSSYAPGPNCDALLRKAKRQLDKHKGILDEVVNTFSGLDPSQIELVSTMHYIQRSYSEWRKERPSKDQLVQTVLEIKKEKFSEDSVKRVYEVLMRAGLLR